MTALTTGDALRMIIENDELRTLVYVAMLRASTPLHHHDQCVLAAGHLYASGWLQVHRDNRHNGYGAESIEEAVVRISRDAWRELRRAQIIPAGFVARWRWGRAMSPFLPVLIQAWLIP